MGLKDPDFGFSPDAESQLLMVKKVILQPISNFEGQNDGDFSLVSFKWWFA